MTAPDDAELLRMSKEIEAGGRRPIYPTWLLAEKLAAGCLALLERLTKAEEDRNYFHKAADDCMRGDVAVRENAVRLFAAIQQERDVAQAVLAEERGAFRAAAQNVAIAAKALGDRIAQPPIDLDALTREFNRLVDAIGVPPTGDTLVVTYAVR